MNKIYMNASCDVKKIMNGFKYLLFISCMFMAGSVWGQSTANYAFFTNTTGSLALDANGNAVDMTTGTTPLVAAASDEGVSSVSNIGFNFYYMGTVYTQYSVSANGILQLGGTPVSGSTYVASGGSIASPKFSAMGADAITASSLDGGGVTSKLIGTGSNRCLVIQWVVYSYYTNTSLPATYQIRFYESTGIIEYVYGSMPVGSTSYSSGYSVGFSNNTTANNMAFITTSTNAVSYTASSVNTYIANTNITNLHSTSNGSRRVYRFTPTVTSIAGPTNLTFASVTTTGMTLNWTAASPTTGIVRYIVQRSTDGGVTYPVWSNVSLGTNTLAVTGLSPGTNYTYRVVAVSEGVESTSTATGTQATTAGATYYWVGAGAGADFNTASNWNTLANGTGTGRTTPLATDVLIVDGATTVAGSAAIITLGTSSSCGQFLITNNTTVTVTSTTASPRSITINGGGGLDLSIPAGSTLNLTNANPAAFAFAGTGNTGDISGIYNASSNISNVITTTGGTGTLLTVSATGVVNNSIVGSSGCLAGSATTLSFANGSQYNVSGATTLAPWIPLATWGATSTVNLSGLTTSTTAPTNASQTFGNLTINCPLLTASHNWASSATIQGDLNVTTGSGNFRLVSSGTATINGNVLVNAGTFSPFSSSGSVIVQGNTTIASGATLNLSAGSGTYSQRGSTFTNNGTLIGGGTTTGGTLQIFSPSNAAMTLAGTGTVSSALTTLSVQSIGGLTIPHTNQIPVLRTNLFTGTVTNSNKITMGTGAALAVTFQTGSTGSTNNGGTFDQSPTWNLGTGTYSLIYSQELGNRTTGFEIPPTRTVNNITNSNSNGLTINGGALSSAALTLSSGCGNITTSGANILRITGTTTSAITRTSTTAYINGPLELTLPASLATGSTYTFPIGKSAVNPFVLVNPTTNSGGTVTIQSEVFDASTGGTPGNLMGTLNTNKYWATSVTSGSANFTNTLIQLTDAPNGADAIAGSTTLAGAYDLVGGLTSTSTATSLTTTAPASTSLLGFYVMGNKASPTLASLSITPSGNACPHVARTVSVNVTPAGAPITGVTINYSINGATPIVVNMTNTTNNGGLLMDSWTGTIPTVTPTNATITWSVLATDAALLTKSQTGVSYTDEGLGNEVITITPSVANFCGTGGNVTLTASSSIPGVVYTWTSLTSSATLSASTGASVTATITETSDFRVVGTPNNGSCPSEAYKSVGVYALPSATVTTTASGVCPGTSATINSGLSAGNFISLPVTANIKTAPSTAVTICNAGVGTPVPVGTSGTNYDDGGWANLPIGFNFNFFGTNYSTLNAGTNGNLMFGTFNATALADFTFTTLPSASEPLNMVALLAMDNDLTGTTGGTIKYWTEGYAPNRKFIISYENVKEFGDTKFSTFQGVFYETTGIIEVHVGSSTNIDRNKVTGVNNGDGTIGVLAYASGTTASATNPISSAFAYRFSPPANYTTTWSASNTNGTSTLATGTNIFSQSVAPSITTTYSISYTNQTTGCTNAAGSAQVVMNILNSNAPSGINTVVSASSICLGESVNLSMDYTGSNDGLVFQWQSSIDNGTTWQNIASATATTTTVTPTVPTRYRCQITSCGGTPGFSSAASVSFSNEITGTTAATRCGTGTASIQATGNAGTTVNWYANATGGSPIGTGSSFTTPVLSASTTYFVAAETNSVLTGMGANGSIVPNNNLLTSERGIVISVTANSVLNTAQFFAASGSYAGTARLLNNTDGSVVTTTPISGTATVSGMETMNLNWNLEAGKTYRLLLALSTGTYSNNNSSVDYSSATWNNLGTSGVILSGFDFSSPSSSSYSNFYNMQLTSFCSSIRVPVVVTVNPAPALTLSGSSSSICSGTSTTVPVTITSNAADFNTYTWSPSTGVSGNSSTGWLFNPTETTNYTLSGAQTSGALCSNTAVYTISVNPLPSSMTLSPSVTTGVCNGSIQTISLTSGGLADANYNLGLSSDLSSNLGSYSSYGMYFKNTNSTAITIKSIDVYPSTAGTLTIQLKNASGTVVSSKDFTIVASDISTSVVKTLNLDFSVPANSIGWQLYYSSISINRGGGTYVYPSIVSNFSITGNTLDGDNLSSGTRYYFYNWKISVPTQQPITWSPATDLYTDAAATAAYTGTAATTLYTKPTANRTYTATATIASTGCTNTKTVQLNNRVPTNNVVLASATTSGAVEQCTDANGWTYYATTAKPDEWLFGIHKNGNTFTATVDINVDNTNKFQKSTSSNGANQEHASYIMSRYWNATLSSGSIASNSSVKVRFFIDTQDITDLLNARDNDYNTLKNTTNPSTLAVISGTENFKTVGTTYNPTNWTGNKYNGSIVKLTQDDTATLNGQTYVELSGITSFSGGSIGAAFGPSSNGLFNSGGTVGLPVTWKDVKATVKEEGNLIQWTTSSEKNTSHFEVEYSYDAKTFFKASNDIKAAINSTTDKSYDFMHLEEYGELVYYRIKQVDLDGKVDYSKAVVAKRTSKLPEFHVSMYPVPLNVQDLTVRIQTVQKTDITITINDLLGRSVYTERVSPQGYATDHKLSLGYLQNGTYHVTIDNGLHKSVQVLVVGK